MEKLMELSQVEEQKHLEPNQEILANAIFGNNAYYLDWKKSHCDWITGKIKRPDGMVWLPWKEQLWLLEVEWEENSNIIQQLRAFAKSKVSRKKLKSSLKRCLKQMESTLNKAERPLSDGHIINGIIEATLDNHHDGEYFRPHMWVLLGHRPGNYKALKEEYLEELKARFKNEQQYLLSMARLFYNNFNSYILLEQLYSKCSHNEIAFEKFLLVPAFFSLSGSGNDQGKIISNQGTYGSAEELATQISDTPQLESEIDGSSDSGGFVINPNTVRGGRAGQFWSYLSSKDSSLSPENVVLRIKIDKDKSHDFKPDWAHLGSEFMVFSTGAQHKKPAIAAKEVFGKNALNNYGNIARRFGTFIDTSKQPFEKIVAYSKVEDSLRSDPPGSPGNIGSNDNGRKTYFDPPLDNHKRRQIHKNILNRRKLWKEFLNKEKMSVDEFKRLGEFEPHAIAGFFKFLEYNEIASRYGDTFTVDKKVIPHIKGWLGSDYN